MTVLDGILGTFTEVGEWFTTFVPSLEVLFWTSTAEGGQLTFLGVLAVAGLSISVVFLAVGLIQNFLHFRA